MFFLQNHVAVTYSHTNGQQIGRLATETTSTFQTVATVWNAVNSMGAQRFIQELEDDWELLMLPAIDAGNSEVLEFTDDEGGLVVEVHPEGLSTVNTQYLRLTVDGVEYENAAYLVYDDLKAAGIPAAKVFQHLKRIYSEGLGILDKPFTLTTGQTVVVLEAED